LSKHLRWAQKQKACLELKFLIIVSKYSHALNVDLFNCIATKSRAMENSVIHCDICETEMNSL
jgi:hypothetical protein